MSVLDTARSVASHRGMSCLELHRLLGALQRKVHRLTERAEQATAMAGRIDEQALTIGSLRQQLDDSKRIRADILAKANRYDEAEGRAKVAGQMLADQTAELLELRAFKANVTSVSTLPTPVPPAVPTQTRFDQGPAVRLGASPMATTNPGRPAPSRAKADEPAMDDTQPVPVIGAQSEAVAG
ncbi:hypothetical protein MUK60_07725 [Streptomyces sp. LRE541]|uniref:hypothetical protein n=1 Tax=Streptomyces sp. LRE541 TaxID=2931983 RepID=UPI00200EF673|nr:hypothetical protein [Streptomyces sp. LRE541]UPZ27723.1 hypothetical protein MUK60_07725 [Streptomyces sp. LRE541]